VVHACNPRYSRDRDQEDCSSKPAQANTLPGPILKKPITKIIKIVKDLNAHFTKEDTWIVSPQNVLIIISPWGNTNYRHKLTSLNN
jgi:hypothetical protein